MTTARPTESVRLPALPHWESTPDDLPAAIAEIKQALRSRIAASGRTVEQVFAVMEARVQRAVDDILAAKARGESVWPVIAYDDIAAGTVTEQQLAYLRRRGCVTGRSSRLRKACTRWASSMPAIRSPTRSPCRRRCRW